MAPKDALAPPLSDKGLADCNGGMTSPLEGPPPGRRLGIFGGTFDPLHLGHLVGASEAVAVLELDEVIFVPTGQPWQKAGAPITHAVHRVRMTELAAEPDPRFSVSAVDVERPGPTYTVDTLRDLRRDRPGAEWYFIAGADSLSSMPTWKHSEQVVQQVQLVGLTRPGYDLVTPPQVHGTSVLLVDMPALDISSRTCRSRVRQGLPIRYLVPDAVERYIADHGLYLS